MKNLFMFNNNDDKCTLKFNQHIYYISALREECTSSYDCYLEADIDGMTVHCYKGMCMCKPDYHPAPDHLECLQGQ